MPLTPDQRPFVEAARTAILATIAPDGSPRVVPICFVLAEDATLWSPLDEKPKRAEDPRELARVRDILARPEVSLLVHRWDEDWSRLGWVRVSGRARLVEPGEQPIEVVDALRAKYPQYDAQAIDRRPMLAIAMDRASDWGALDP